MQRQRGFVWAAIILCIIALLFQFLAVCLPHWERYKMPMTKGSILRGLFSTCEIMEDDDDDGGAICLMHKTIPAWLDVVRTFEMFGLVLLFIVAILLTLYLLLLQWKVVLHMIFIVTLFVIVFFLLIGISVYGHNAHGKHLHVAYAFAVIATILTIVPPILLIVVCCFRRKGNVWIDQEPETYDQEFLATEMPSSSSRRSSKVGPITDTQEQRTASRASQAIYDQTKEPLP
ncbi:uncharacterized protein LOC117336799 [Pecten maximus]|uniref:uncharacterized protein LOC117336799 n=1 Tax=Pecten maximus TaxID=6579 RepID=UPI0014584AFF|nr:uncharacterized protein LOC117336799 [Pecten maximus]